MLKTSFWLPVILVSLVFSIGFFVSGFTYDVPCPECGSDGEVTCGYCNGQGRKLMPVWEDFPDLNYVWDDCPVCKGTGTVSCNLCEGTGDFWMLSVTSSSLLFSLLQLAIFFVLFRLENAIQSIYLESNPWVRDIEKMSWGYFRPMYWTWVFYHDRKRWAKYSMVFLSICTPVGVLIWSLIYTSFLEYPRMTPEVFSIGFAFGTILLILFAIKWYLVFAKKTMTHTEIIS